MYVIPPLKYQLLSCIDLTPISGAVDPRVEDKDDAVVWDAVCETWSYGCRRRHGNEDYNHTYAGSGLFFIYNVRLLDSPVIIVTFCASAGYDGCTRQSSLSFRQNYNPKPKICDIRTTVRDIRSQHPRVDWGCCFVSDFSSHIEIM